jgi:hypothetical protein
MASFVFSLPFWVLADLSTIPAIAIVGGAIPSQLVRRRAGWVTFILQGLILAYIFVSAIGGTVTGVQANHLEATTAAASPSQPKAGTPPAPTPSKSNDGAEIAKIVLMMSLATIVAIQIFYTMLFASLYGAGRRGVKEARDEAESSAKVKTRPSYGDEDYPGEWYKGK